MVLKRLIGLVFAGALAFSAAAADIEGNQIKQTGMLNMLNKGVGIPFEMTGAMSATADGRIRINLPR